MARLHRHHFHRLTLDYAAYAYIHLSERVCREDECDSVPCPCMVCYADRSHDDLKEIFKDIEFRNRLQMKALTLDYMKLLNPPRTNWPNFTA